MRRALLSWRSLTLVLGALAFAGGCSREGTYTLSLKFGTAEAPVDITPFLCGYHGIGAWLVTENGEIGDVFPCGQNENPAAPTQGPLIRHKKPGNYQVIIRALEPSGARKVNPGDTIPDLSPYLRVGPVDVVVTDGETTTVPGPLFILPLPECLDGVDNDCDLRIDHTDPSCVLPTAIACSRDIPCPDATTQVCNLALSTCVSAGKELGDDDPAGTGCVNEKKDGGVDVASGGGGAAGGAPAGGAGGGAGSAQGGTAGGEAGGMSLGGAGEAGAGGIGSGLGGESGGASGFPPP